jgi:hypothetical protein
MLPIINYPIKRVLLLSSGYELLVILLVFSIVLVPWLLLLLVMLVLCVLLPLLRLLIYLSHLLLPIGSLMLGTIFRGIIRTLDRVSLSVTLTRLLFISCGYWLLKVFIICSICFWLILNITIPFTLSIISLGLIISVSFCLNLCVTSIFWVTLEILYEVIHNLHVIKLCLLPVSSFLVYLSISIVISNSFIQLTLTFLTSRIIYFIIKRCLQFLGLLLFGRWLCCTFSPSLRFFIICSLFQPVLASIA